MGDLSQYEPGGNRQEGGDRGGYGGAKFNCGTNRYGMGGVRQGSRSHMRDVWLDKRAGGGSGGGRGKKQ